MLVILKHINKKENASKMLGRPFWTQLSDRWKHFESQDSFTDYNDSVFFPVICSLPSTVMWIFNLSRIYKTCFTSIIILSFVKQSANKMTLKEYKGHKISTNLDNFIRFEKWAIMLYADLHCTIKTFFRM